MEKRHQIPRLCITNKIFKNVTSLFRQNCFSSFVHMRNTCLGPCIRNNAFSSLQLKEAAWLGLPHSTLSVIGNSITHFLHVYNNNYSTVHRCVSKPWLLCNIIWTYFCGWNGHAIGAKWRQFASCDCNTIYTAAYPKCCGIRLHPIENVSVVG